MAAAKRKRRLTTTNIISEIELYYSSTFIDNMGTLRGCHTPKRHERPMIAALGSLFRPPAYAGTRPNVKLDLDLFTKNWRGRCILLALATVAPAASGKRPDTYRAGGISVAPTEQLGWEKADHLAADRHFERARRVPERGNHHGPTHAPTSDGDQTDAYGEGAGIRPHRSPGSAAPPYIRMRAVPPRTGKAWNRSAP